MLRVYVTSFFGVTDFLAVAPYYLELIAHADTSISQYSARLPFPCARLTTTERVVFRFSILRIFRLLRVFRAFRYSNTVILTIEVMRISIDLSKDALLALVRLSQSSQFPRSMLTPRFPLSVLFHPHGRHHLLHSRLLC